MPILRLAGKASIRRRPVNSALGCIPMPFGPISAVMIHVADVAEGLTWYQKAFPNAARMSINDQGFECLELEGLRIEVVPEDSKVSAGPAGTVVYWSVPNFAEALDRLEGLGATLYRGPMHIEEGKTMCQVQDPWGNCLGIRGK